VIGLRIAQGLLCAVEVCGLYFLIQLFFERRWDSSFSKILWMISGCFMRTYNLSKGSGVDVFEIFYARMHCAFCVPYKILC